MQLNQLKSDNKKELLDSMKYLRKNYLWEVEYIKLKMLYRSIICDT